MYDSIPDADDDAAELAWVVDAAWHGQRLDKALAAWMPQWSRAYLSRLIADGAVDVDAVPCGRAAAKLKVGQQVALQWRAPAAATPAMPQPVAFDVVHQDAALCVVNKPAGLVVHPAAGNWQGTLLNGLLHRDPAAAELPRAGIVHRLDKDTTGLMVVARSRLAMESLTRQLAQRSVSRDYVALAHGSATPGQRLTLEGWIGRDPRQRLRMAVWDHAARVRARPKPMPPAWAAPPGSRCGRASCTPDAPIKFVCTCATLATLWWATHCTVAKRFWACSGRPCTRCSCNCCTPPAVSL